MDEAADDERPLDADHAHQEVEADAAEAVALEERHQEAETKEEHDVHVLEV